MPCARVPDASWSADALRWLCATGHKSLWAIHFASDLLSRARVVPRSRVRCRHMKCPTRLQIASVIVVALTIAATTPMAQLLRDCLFDNVVGSEQRNVTRCDTGSEDASNIARNPNVLKIMAAFKIAPDSVRFLGCSRIPFSAGNDFIEGRKIKYVITYPTEATAFLAPIAHELAHVLQIETAGGLSALRAQRRSKEIELGADFLTGVAFSQVLPSADLDEFQHSLSLIGAYVELDPEAHGTPAQRTAAFRTGVFLSFDRVNWDFRQADKYFHTDVYGAVAQQ